MEDLPEIALVRKLCDHLTEAEIKEEEKLLYDLCNIAKEIYEKQKLTRKNKELK